MRTVTPGLLKEAIGEALHQPLLAFLDRSPADGDGTHERHLNITCPVDREITRKLRLTEDCNHDAIAGCELVTAHVA